MSAATSPGEVTVSLKQVAEAAAEARAELAKTAVELPHEDGAAFMRLVDAAFGVFFAKISATAARAHKP